MNRISWILGAALLVSGATACKKEASQLESLARSAPARRAEASAEPTELPKGDIDGRLARVERKITKITGILDQALGPAEPDPAQVYSVAVDPIDPVIGPATAPVTIIEGFEFACPYCRMVAPTVDKIIAAYPDKVRVVHKYILIHGQPAIPSSLAACAANKQGKYKEMENAIWGSVFSPEGKVQPEKLAAENMVALAAGLQLDATKFNADMNGPECASWKDSSSAAMRPVGTSGTPAFYVNGRFVNGALPFEAFDALVKEELAKAEKAIADGTPAADFYQKTVVAQGLKKVAGRFDD